MQQYHRSVTKRRPSLAVAANANTRPPVVIVGGGIAGLATAVALRARGIDDVLVLESAPSPRAEGFALSLWANAWRALDALGPEVAAAARAASGPPLRELEFASSSGRVLRRFTVREATRLDEDDDGDSSSSLSYSDEFRGVRRAELLGALLKALPEGSVRYGVRGELLLPPAAETQQQQQDQPRLPRVRLVPTKEAAAAEGEEIITARCVVGADSARSLVATQTLSLPTPRYNGYVAWRGVAVGGGESTDTTRPVRLALGAGVRAGVYPLGRGETYWFVTRNATEVEAARGLPAIGDGAALKKQALEAVRGWGWPGMRELIEATPDESMSRARIGDRWTFGRREEGGEGEGEGGGVGRGRVTLAGDALHPMSPNLGQGGCTALEDAPVLAAALARAFEIEEKEGQQKGGDVVARALRAYERERLRRTTPLTLRSAAVGFALQLPYAPVVAVRDLVIERVFRPKGFLEHTRYDCRRAAAEVEQAIR
jgi:2-polyprenyl-6-methoxyphenol hydroxylase-like FAD-dependent oxidoreductase